MTDSYFAYLIDKAPSGIMNAPVKLRSSHDAMVKRIRRFARDLPDEYKGSRTALNRYLYKNTNLENFIELKEDGPNPKLFPKRLLAVKGVRCVTGMGDHWAVFFARVWQRDARDFARRAP